MINLASLNWTTLRHRFLAPLNLTIVSFLKKQRYTISQGKKRSNINVNTHASMLATICLTAEIKTLYCTKYKRTNVRLTALRDYQTLNEEIIELFRQKFCYCFQIYKRFLNENKTEAQNSVIMLQWRSIAICRSRIFARNAALNTIIKAD